MYICTYLYIYILNYNVFGLYNLPVCLFSQSSIWHWTTNWYAFHWGRPSIWFPAFLIYLYFSVSYWGLMAFAYIVWHVLWCHSYSAYIWAIMLVRLYVSSSWQEIPSQAQKTPWSSVFYTHLIFLCHLLCCSLSLLGFQVLPRFTIPGLIFNLCNRP